MKVTAGAKVEAAILSGGLYRWGLEQVGSREGELTEKIRTEDLTGHMSGKGKEQ